LNTNTSQRVEHVEDLRPAGGELVPASEVRRAMAARVIPTDPPAPLIQPGGQIAAAIAQARENCEAVRKDSTNNFHHYNYASADAVIGAAKAAMKGTGLSIITLDWELRTTGSGLQVSCEVIRHLLLAHTSGESVPIRIPWPVIPEKGRPLDKALGGALSSSLAYWLRDLLLIPRDGAGDDNDARDDRQHQPATPPPPPPAEKPKPRPTAGQLFEKLVAKLSRIAELSGEKVEAVTDRLWAAVGLSESGSLEDITDDQWRKAFGATNAKLKKLEELKKAEQQTKGNEQ
jgi:hypothetical protein